MSKPAVPASKLTDDSNAPTSRGASQALREAQASDVGAITELVNSAYRGESSQAGWTTEANILGGQRTDAEAIAGMVAANGQAKEQTILVYEERGKVCACVYLKQKGSTAYLGMLTVSPKLQAGGIGRVLLVGGENWAKTNWQSVRIEMTVIESRLELIAWYERRGYLRTPKREPFPSHDPRFGVPLVENLMFIVLEKEF